MLYVFELLTRVTMSVVWVAEVTLGASTQSRFASRSAIAIRISFPASERRTKCVNPRRVHGRLEGIGERETLAEGEHLKPAETPWTKLHSPTKSVLAATRTLSRWDLDEHRSHCFTGRDGRQ